MATPKARILSDDRQMCLELAELIDGHISCASERIPVSALRRGKALERPAFCVFVDIRTKDLWERLSLLRDELQKRNLQSLTCIGIANDHLPLSCVNLANQLFDMLLPFPFQSHVVESLARRITCGLCSGFSTGETWDARTSEDRFFTQTPELFSTLDDVLTAAQTNYTILLVGETGTGKTTLARIVHEHSPRCKGPFVNVACGSLSRELIGSELFGHAKGAFTGADMERLGKLDFAGDGTILLDEIDVLGLQEQMKLLRVLETGEFEPIGSNQTRTCRARVIVASNVDLDVLCEQGTFRADLFYRLDQMRFELPALRARPRDIIPLAVDAIEQFSRNDSMKIEQVGLDFISVLKRYHWPGNVRELRNAIRRAMLFAQNRILHSDLLSSEIVHRATRHTSENQQTRPAPQLAGHTAQTEKAIIERTLQDHGFNRASTARALGISRVTLYNKLRKHGIETTIEKPNSPK